MSLGSWANQERTSILFVTKDKGCTSYCETDGRLAAIDDLGAALTLVQERNDHTRKLTDLVARRIEQGAYPEFAEQLTRRISDSLHDIDFRPEATSAFYFDAEMDDEHVVDAKFESKDGIPVLNPVGYVDDELAVQGNVVVNLEVVGVFSFSVRDGIDRDMVRIGRGRAARKLRLNIEVLYTFEDFANDEPELVEIEIVPTSIDVNFGEVGPDYES
ncbi:hypothetical protein BCh11DRAFT_07461 [Burkholderia sp. Ch1-1]|nr:hypothetical protein BCh11DRAFT_07461 [Burkholderia sp. Ch1-1]